MGRVVSSRWNERKCGSVRPSVDRLHPLLSRRFSPSAFDPAHKLTAAEADLLVEAARWAPSAGNSQPWAFIVGRRDDDVHSRLAQHLAGSSAVWAPSASLLIANLSHRYVEETDWDYSEFSLYDLGQAVAHMTVQAQAMGMLVRQFRAFDRAGLAREFDVPSHWEVTTMSAIGRPRPPRAEKRSDHARPRARERRPLDHIKWPLPTPD
jgi:nitroreductase